MNIYTVSPDHIGQGTNTPGFELSELITRLNTAASTADLPVDFRPVEAGKAYLMAPFSEAGPDLDTGHRLLAGVVFAATLETYTNELNYKAGLL